jgi:predicted DNA-binding transcriptional regulator AlpA
MGQLQQSSSTLGQTNPVELPEILTAKELEAFLRIDVKTIYGYVQRGLIPYIRIQSNLRFRKREVLDWIASQSYALHASGNGHRKNHQSSPE